jgi:hypothetical protein
MIRCLAGFAVIFLGANSLRAQSDALPGSSAGDGQPQASTEPPVEPAFTDLDLGAQTPPASDWHVSFTPYFWLTSFSGSVEAKGVSVDLDKSVIDILEGSDLILGLMGSLDVDYKRFVFQVNAAWGTVEGSDEQAILRNGTLDADVDVDGAFTELFGGYRLVDASLRDSAENPGRFKLDAFGGGRISRVNVEADLRASTSITLPGGPVITADRSQDVEKSGDWFEPFVGVRAIVELDEHWVLNFRGDVGGFDVDGSEFAWQAAAVVGYRWRLEGWDIALIGGYRALGQDYSDGDFHWDVITHGPMLGVSFSWAF